MSLIQVRKQEVKTGKREVNLRSFSFHPSNSSFTATLLVQQSDQCVFCMIDSAANSEATFSGAAEVETCGQADVTLPSGETTDAQVCSESGLDAGQCVSAACLLSGPGTIQILRDGHAIAAD